MQDFEALGRYVTAEGEARNAVATRDKALRDARSIIDQTMSGSNQGHLMIGYDFDPARLLELINEAAEAHKNVLAAVAEANLQAPKCGKNALEVRSPRGY